jgi:hypothetical protein
MNEDLVAELREIVSPEPDEDGDVQIEFPPPDLLNVHGLDAASYSTRIEVSTRVVRCINTLASEAKTTC